MQTVDLSIKEKLVFGKYRESLIKSTKELKTVKTESRKSVEVEIKRTKSNEISKENEFKMNDNPLDISIFQGDKFQIIDAKWKNKEIQQVVPKEQALKIKQNKLGEEEIIYQGVLLKYNILRMKVPVWSKLYSERYCVLTRNVLKWQLN